MADQKVGPSYRWQVVAMLWAISFFNYADRQAIYSVFPLLQKSMSLTNVELGLLGSAFAWVYGLGGMFAGMVVDRIRRKTAIIGGLYAWSIICAATAAVTGFRGLFIMRAAEGLGEMFYYPASMSFVSDYHGPKTRSRAIGIHQTSVYIGTIAGGFFAGLIGQYYGWRWSFVLFGSLGILLGLVLTRHLIEPVRGQLEPESTGTGTFRSKGLYLLMGAFCCANFVAVVLLTWMPKFLFDRFHLSLAMSGLTATIYVQLASMCGSVCGGWWADKWRAKTPGGRMLVQAIGVFGGAPFVVLCGMTSSIGWLITALTAWGFFKGLYDANIFASAFDIVAPAYRGRAAGLMNTVGWLAGGGSAPLVIGWISQSQGLGTAIAMAASVYLLAGVLLLLASRVPQLSGSSGSPALS
jgi:MFS family permease